jgi:hypothetical protein
MGRENAVRVTLTGDELARLDELRPTGMSPALAPPRTADRPRGRHRTEASAILTALARDGRVAAATALERATREEGPVDDAPDENLGGAG